jgi:hypothetical protein
MGKAVKVFLGAFLRFLLYYARLKMDQKHEEKLLEDILKKAKGLAICELTVSRDYHDSIFLKLSEDYNLKIVYGHNSLAGAYYVANDSMILYSNARDTEKLPTIADLKETTRRTLKTTAEKESKVYDDAELSNLIAAKFIERGAKKLALKTIPGDDETKRDIFIITTENSALALGMRYFERKVIYRVGQGKDMRRGEI